MKKVLLPIVFSAFIFTGTVFAQTPPPAQPPSTPTSVEAPKPHHEHERDRHPEIHKAMRKLRGAKDDLQKAAHDFGGHKAKALAAIDEALSELHEALAYDTK